MVPVLEGAAQAARVIGPPALQFFSGLIGGKLGEEIKEWLDEKKPEKKADDAATIKSMDLPPNLPPTPPSEPPEKLGSDEEVFPAVNPEPLQIGGQPAIEAIKQNPLIFEEISTNFRDQLSQILESHHVERRLYWRSSSWSGSAMVSE